jgi:WD40 repeat protein
MTALAPVRESGLTAVSRSPIQSLAYSPDSRLLASGDTQRQAKIWFQGQTIHEINLSSRQDKIRPTERIRSFVFSPLGDTLYVACGDTARAFNMTSGEMKWMFRPARSFGFLIVSPICLAVSTSGEVAMATDAGRISLWTSEGAMRSHFWDNDSPRHIAFLDEERVVGSDSFTLCSWKIEMGRKLTRKRLTERVYGFAAAPSAGLVAVRTIHAVEVWDMHADLLVATHPVPFGPPLIAISPDGKRIFFGGTSDIIAASLEDGGSASIQIQGASIRSLAVRPDGKELVAGCSDGSLRFWDLT